MRLAVAVLGLPTRRTGELWRLISESGQELARFHELPLIDSLQTIPRVHENGVVFS